jgi:hypothetical protein
LIDREEPNRKLETMESRALALALAAIEPLLVAYWVLATASVVVTVLPSPAPQAFK